MVRIIVALVALVGFAQAAGAQQSHASVGGSVSLVTQPHSSEQPIGGTTRGVSALVGAQVAPRLAIEFEPSFDGSYAWQYTYRPAPSLLATVVATRQEAFFPVQARIRLRLLEPVIGVGVVHSKIARHATVANGTSYFDDGRSDNNLAVVAGLDAAFRLVSNVYLVPTFRVRVGPRASEFSADPLGEQTATGALNLRYGVGARVTF